MSDNSEPVVNGAEQVVSAVPASVPSAGPWRGCKDGDCSCGMIWSVPGDHPVATVESGPWGDTWPALRSFDNGNMPGTAVEAYMERSDYGEVDPDVAKANARLIAAAPDMLEQLRNASWLLADISPDGLVKKQIDEVIARAQGIEAATADETGTGSGRSPTSAVANGDLPEPCTQTHTTKKKGNK